MVSLLYKWLLLFSLAMPAPEHHPVFVSVTEIEHNTKEQTLEITCKIFTDDFEKTLRKTTSTKVDLLNPALKEPMGKLISDYIFHHFGLKIDGKTPAVQFLGFEQQEEGVMSYLQVEHVASLKSLSVFDNFLYEYSPQQISIIHATVNGERKSTKLINPESNAFFQW